MNRPLLLAAVGAGALVVVLVVFLRGGDSDKAKSAPATPPGTVNPSADTTPPPVRMQSPPPVAGTTDTNRPRPQIRSTGSPLSSSFEGQERDEVWARDTEAEIGARLEAALEKYRDTVTVPRVECKQQVCRLAIVGTDETQFRQFVEALQDEGGFYGYADQLMLEAPTSSPGSMSIRVFLVFNR